MIVTPLSRSCCIAIIFSALWVGLGAAPAADPLETVRNAATEWVKVRTETARLESEWRSDRALLESTINGLQARATELEEKRDNVKAASAKDRDEIDAMRAKNNDAAADLQTAEARLAALDERLFKLRPTLPPRLADALEMSFRSLTGGKLNASERMQATMTILSRCAEFNRAVTSDEEVLTIDGTAKSFETIYWGLSHGYALDRAAGKAWLGLTGPQGWRWEPQPEAVSAIKHLIAIYAGKSDPDFVVVPAQLAHAAGEAPGR